jgi:hypothetical protein
VRHRSPTRQHFFLSAFLSLTGGATLSATAPLPLSPFSSPPPARAHSATPRTRALDGTVARPAGPDAESPRARGLVPVGRGFYPSAPAPRFLRLGLRGGGRCQLGRPGGQTGGRTGLSRRLSRRRVTNPGGGGETPVSQATNPIGVFVSFFSCVCVVRVGEQGRRRRAAPRRSKSGVAPPPARYCWG